ncbi:hypothetical protein [Streptomyces eurocidicus]|uniref:Uncharacterized protein n=1 Tax=Streptomyces eurocidicus TaxID=66423 RepID=A0A7W8B8G2_STREU|nr:hypothetical protein [Streptomyces eurocidicus]MBB5118716.1 hypothetical protein [Streptomyces eurocidicus]
MTNTRDVVATVAAAVGQLALVLHVVLSWLTSRSATTAVRTGDRP